MPSLHLGDKLHSSTAAALQTITKAPSHAKHLSNRRIKENQNHSANAVSDDYSHKKIKQQPRKYRDKGNSYLKTQIVGLTIFESLWIADVLRIFHRIQQLSHDRPLTPVA